MPKTAIEQLKIRLAELRLAKEQARAFHNTLFDLHLADEIMQMHKLMHDLDVRIEQIEFLIHRHAGSIDNSGE